MLDPRAHTITSSRRCLATVTLGGTLVEKLRATALAHFEGVELAQSDLEASSVTATDVYHLARDLGLAVNVLQPLRDVESLPDSDYVRGCDRACRMLDTASELGAETMLVCSNTSTLAIDDPDRAAGQLHHLADLAAERGLQIGFEALSWGTVIKTQRAAWDVVSRAPHPNLGLVVDSFHACALNEDTSFLETVPSHRLLMVQLADAPAVQGDLMRWSRRMRCFPGDGVFDIVSFLRHVLSSGYRGPVSLEVFSDHLKTLPPIECARRAMASLARLEHTASTVPRVAPFGALCPQDEHPL